MSAPTRSSSNASGDAASRRRLLVGLLAGAAAVCLPAIDVAWADPLDDARASGAVGERFDGYAVLRDASAPAATRQLVEDVNTKRRQLYNQVAAREGTTVEAVGRIYARQIIQNVPPGTWIQREDGSWVRK